MRGEATEDDAWSAHARTTARAPAPAPARRLPAAEHRDRFGGPDALGQRTVLRAGERRVAGEERRGRAARAGEEQEVPGQARRGEPRGPVLARAEDLPHAPALEVGLGHREPVVRGGEDLEARG